MTWQILLNKHSFGEKYYGEAKPYIIRVPQSFFLVAAVRKVASGASLVSFEKLVTNSPQDWPENLGRLKVSKTKIDVKIFGRGERGHMSGSAQRPLPAQGFGWY